MKARSNRARSARAFVEQAQLPLGVVGPLDVAGYIGPLVVSHSETASGPP